jgi:hypothetical protein
MRNSSKLAAIFFGLAGALYLAAPKCLLAQAPQEKPAPSYPRTPDGFNAQFSAIAEAYQRGDSAAGRHLLEQLHLAKSSDWLADNVAPELINELTKRYDQMFADLLPSMDKTFQDFAHTKGAKLTTRLKECTHDPPHELPPPAPWHTKLSGLVPMQESVCYMGSLLVRTYGKGQTFLTGEVAYAGWADTYTYQDGAFRFVGYGGWPFWVWADGSEGKAPPDGYLVRALDKIDEIIPFEIDKVIAALKPAMESSQCQVGEATPNHIECKRPRAKGEGGESVTALLDAQGNQTRVQLSTGRGYLGRFAKRSWSGDIFAEMMRILRKPQP